MATSRALVETLKKELRARSLTYALVARHLELSEATVKRMFSTNEFSLDRLDRICALAGLEFSDLARSIGREQTVIAQLTHIQEKEFVDNPKLMLAALCVLNHWTFEDITAYYDVSSAECVRLLTRLDKLRFIELLPHNRIRLLVSRAFSWLPDGPIQRMFKGQVQTDFFNVNFDKPQEVLLLASGSVSSASLASLITKLKRTASEFAEMRSDDAKMPVRVRSPVTLLLAARSWEPEFARKFRRPTPQRSAIRAVPSQRARS